MGGVRCMLRKPDWRGRAAGMATIAVTWGAATADDLADAGPTAVVSSVAELAAQLLIDSR